MRVFWDSVLPVRNARRSQTILTNQQQTTSRIVALTPSIFMCSSSLTIWTIECYVLYGTAVVQHCIYGLRSYFTSSTICAPVVNKPNIEGVTLLLIRIYCSFFQKATNCFSFMFYSCTPCRVVSFTSMIRIWRTSTVWKWTRRTGRMLEALSCAYE